MTLTIAFYPSLVSGRLQESFANYRADWPNDRLEFVELDATEQLTALRDRRGDVGFLFAEGDIPGVDSELLWREPAYLATPKSHPLAERTPLRGSALRDADLLMHAHKSGVAELVCLAERLRLGGMEPNVRMHHVSREGLLGLVAAGYGVTVVSEAACGMNYSGVLFREIEDQDARFPVRMAWIAGNDNPALRRLLSFVRAGAQRASGVKGSRLRSNRK